MVFGELDGIPKKYPHVRVRGRYDLAYVRGGLDWP